MEIYFHHSKARFIFLISALLCLAKTEAQIPLKGVITVQNSKTKTGKTEYVPRAQVDAPGHAQPQQSDSKGWFTLRIVGLQYGYKVPVVVTLPQATWQDYIVVNADELKAWKIGYDTVNIYVAKAEDFERMKSEIARINFDNYVSKKQYEQMRQRLQQELAVTKSRSERYKEILDSLTVINDDEDRMQQLVESFAERIARINMDNMSGTDTLTESRRRAYECAIRGEADSVMYYLNDRIDLLHRATNEKESAIRLAAAAGRLAEETKKRQQKAERDHAALVEDVLLMARTGAAQLNYEEAQKYYIEAMNADTLNYETLHEYLNYLMYGVNLWEEAKALVEKRLHVWKKLCEENPQQYLTECAQTYLWLQAYYQQTYFSVDTNQCKKMYNYADTAAMLFEQAEQMNRALPYQAHAHAMNAKGVASIFLFNATNDARYLLQAKNSFTSMMAKYEELKTKAAELKQGTYISDKGNYGHFLLKSGETAKAREIYLQCIRDCANLLPVRGADYYVSYCKFLLNVGDIYLIENQYDEAYEYYDRSFQILDSLSDLNPRLYGAEHIGLLQNVHNVLLQKAVHYGYMVTVLEKMRDCREKVLSKCPEFSNISLFDCDETNINLVWHYLLTGKSKEAKRYAEKCLSEIKDDTDGFIVNCLRINYAHALLINGNCQAAEDIYKSLKPLKMEDGTTFVSLILQDLDELEKQKAISSKDEVEKIRKTLQDN